MDKGYFNSHGQFHRLNGPAVIKEDGTKEWRINDLLHRKNGPAVEYPDGRKEWWIKGYLHREDGPAVECSNGDVQWFILGKELNPEKYIHLKRCKYPNLINAMTIYLVHKL